MPEFVLNKPPHRKPPHAYYSLDEFARGYVEAMFFTNGDCGSEDEYLLNRLGVERLTREAVAGIKKYCHDFQSVIMPDGCFVRQWLNRAEDYDDAQAGRDLWFTSQGHGAGYWDRDQLEENGLGEGLSEAARQHGESSVEVWRGWIYWR